MEEISTAEANLEDAKVALKKAEQQVRTNPPPSSCSFTHGVVKEYKVCPGLILLIFFSHKFKRGKCLSLILSCSFVLASYSILQIEHQGFFLSLIDTITILYVLCFVSFFFFLLGGVWGVGELLKETTIYTLVLANQLIGKDIVQEDRLCTFKGQNVEFIRGAYKRIRNYGSPRFHPNFKTDQTLQLLCVVAGATLAKQGRPLPV